MAIEGDAGASVTLTTADLPAWVRTPGPGMKVERAGVNLAGAEFGAAVPGVYDKDYTYPTTSEIDYFVARGMNVFRIGFLWERMQPTLNGDLDTAEVARLTNIVSYATSAGAMAVLDPHNYARYGGAIIGSTAVPNTAFADFWGKLAGLFKDDPLVAFGLMNEPHDLGSTGTAGWLASANAAIAAIRAVPATNLILVPGDYWTGASSWTKNANATVMPGIVDSANNFVFEVHQYLDADGSGSGTQCVSQTIGVDRVSAFTAWARSAHVRAFLGEFGAPSTETCLYAVDGLLGYLGDNADVWLGWSWWAAGPWWGDYPLSIEPNGGADAPQMVLLDRYLTKP
jgi:endoglucanase